jgi:hypothetical protein
MLLRCATRMLRAPAAMAAGLVFATGIAAGVALGAGAVGAALVGRRLWEERQGWRAGADETAADPVPEAPGI